MAKIKAEIGRKRYIYIFFFNLTIWENKKFLSEFEFDEEISRTKLPYYSQESFPPEL